MLRLTYITSSEEKLNAARQVFNKLESLKLDVPEIQSLDSREIVLFKLKASASVVPDALGRILMVTDDGVVFEGMKGLPGPFLKYFTGLGSEGLYKMAQAFQSHRAIATATVGILVPGTGPVFFEHAIAAAIVPPRGKSDEVCYPIFQPEGHSLTYAEMPAAEREKISHRGIALRKVREYLEKDLELKF